MCYISQQKDLHKDKNSLCTLKLKCIEYICFTPFTLHLFAVECCLLTLIENSLILVSFGKYS